MVPEYEEYLVAQEKEETTELNMANKIQLLGNLIELPSYRDGEVFLCSVPEDLLTLDLKKRKATQNEDFDWSPWPKVPGTVRVGRFLFRTSEKYSYVNRWSRTKAYVRLIAMIDDDEQPIEWMKYEWYRGNTDVRKKFKCYHGRRSYELLDKRALELTDVVERVKAEITEEIRKWVIAENFKAGKEKFGAEAQAWKYEDRKIATRVLKTPEGEKLTAAFKETALGPFDITDEELDTIYGKNKLPNKFKKESPLWEFEYRQLLFMAENHWARKQLMKRQRKLRFEQKKKIMAERNLDDNALAAEKAEHARLERRVKRTQEWVKVSNDVHNSILFLQEFVQHMGNFENIDQDWFDKNRRELRELATKMKPLSRVLNG